MTIRSARWGDLVQDMKEYKETGSERPRKHRGTWEKRWNEGGPLDATALRPSE